MTKQNQAAEARSDKKSRPKVKPIVVEELSDDLAGLAQLLGGPVAAAGDGTIQAQAARLSDRRLQSAQRYALAAQIGRGQGNRHLQQVLTSIKGEAKKAPYQSYMSKSPTGSASDTVMKKSANGPRPATAGKVDVAESIGEEVLEEGLSSSGPPTMAAGEPPPADGRTNTAGGELVEAQVPRFGVERPPSVGRRYLPNNSGQQNLEAWKMGGIRGWTMPREAKTPVELMKGMYQRGSNQLRRLGLPRRAATMEQHGQPAIQRKVFIQQPRISSESKNWGQRSKGFLKLLKWGKDRPRDRGMARAILKDMVSASAPFHFKDWFELRIEIIRRMSTSQLMQESQRQVGGQKAFGYPFRPPSSNYGPRVNYAAQGYWIPKVKDGYAIHKKQIVSYDDFFTRGKHKQYYWKLSKKGKQDPYSAIVKLFAPQAPHKRTLIHCDYLMSLVHFRSFAESLGKGKFNERIHQYGAEKIQLKWNAFHDLQIGSLKKPGMGGLQVVSPASEEDLVIGDHVRFWNHPTYDLINEKIGRAWRLENAVLIQRGKKDIFLGHGSGRKTAQQMREKLAEEYNKVAKDALTLIDWTTSGTTKLQARARAGLKTYYPNLDEKKQWAITGKAIGGQPYDSKLRLITAEEVLGLKDPWHPKQMGEVRRPAESGKD